MEPAEGQLELAGSGLGVEDGALVRRAGDGKTVGRHALSDIEDVRLVAAWDGTGIAFALAGIALVALPRLMAATGAMAWAFLVLGIVLAFFGLLLARKTLLAIGSVHGEIRYKVLDNAEDASGFVATLRALVAEERGNAGAKWGQPE